MDSIDVIARRFLSVVVDVRQQAHQERAELAGEEGPDSADAAHYKWNLLDRPFINEQCLMLMVWLRHELERELVKLVSRMTSDGRDLTRDEYWQRIDDWKLRLRDDASQWKTVKHKLMLSRFPAEWEILEALRMTSNLYKHSPWTTPDEKLLSHLRNLLAVKEAAGQLPAFAADVLAHLRSRNGMQQQDLQPFEPLAESLELMRAFAGILGLKTEPSDYCDVVKALLDHVEDFLKKVRALACSQATWSEVTPGIVPLDPAKFAR